MAARARIIDVDRGMKRAIKTIQTSGRYAVEVGIHEQKGSIDRGGITVAGIAAVHEFGAKIPKRKSKGKGFFRKLADRLGLGAIVIPRRSWLRDGIRDNKKQILARIEKAAASMIDPRKPMPERTAFAQLGFFIARSLRDRVRGGGVFKPKAASTVARQAKGKKGSKKNPIPLIDQGIMVRSITHKVVRALAAGASSDDA